MAIYSLLMLLVWSNGIWMSNGYGLISSSQLSTDGLTIQRGEVPPEHIRHRSLSITTAKVGSLSKVPRRAEVPIAADINLLEPPIPRRMETTTSPPAFDSYQDSNEHWGTRTTTSSEPKVIKEVLKNVVHSSMDDMVTRLSLSLQRFFVAQKRSHPTVTTPQTTTPSTPSTTISNLPLTLTDLKEVVWSQTYLTPTSTVEVAIDHMTTMSPSPIYLSSEDKLEEENLRWLKPILLAFLNKTSQERNVDHFRQPQSLDSLTTSTQATTEQTVVLDEITSTQVPDVTFNQMPTDNNQTDSAVVGTEPLNYVEDELSNETQSSLKSNLTSRVRKPAETLKLEKIIHSTEGDVSVEADTVDLTLTTSNDIDSTMTVANILTWETTSAATETTSEQLSTVTSTMSTSTTKVITTVPPCKAETSATPTSTVAPITLPPLIIYGKNGFTVASKVVTGDPDNLQFKDDSPQLQTSNVVDNKPPQHNTNSYNTSGLLVQTVLISSAAGFALMVIFALALVIIFYNRPAPKLSSRMFGSGTLPYLDSSSRSDVSFVSNDRLIEAYMAVGETVAPTTGRLKIVTERSSDSSILY